MKKDINWKANFTLEKNRGCPRFLTRLFIADSLLVLFVTLNVLSGRIRNLRNFEAELFLRTEFKIFDVRAAVSYTSVS